MSLSQDPRLPTCPEKVESYAWKLNRRLYEIFRDIASAVNIPVSKNTPASTGRFVGEYVRNVDDYIELGSIGAKYTLNGWIWNGTSWTQKRSLTGN